MKPYAEMSREELLAERDALTIEYKGYEEAGLSLNMARGKPSPSQLELSMDMLDVLSKNDVLKSESGDDVRNYGVVEGISEAKKLMADIMECDPSQVLVFGNASLNIMYDTVSRCYTFGTGGCEPWGKQGGIKFLCPVPGYDRHFAVTEDFGIEMINIPMSADGPDMDMVEQYVNNDPAVKGIWCVPKYSNPQVVYSDETVRRFAALKPAAKDFRIFWDNAYCVHHLFPEAERQGKLLNILEECEKAGNPDMVYEFASTSKITFAGAGISALAASAGNLAEIKKHLVIQTIGHDKVNQLRHAKFLKDRAGVDAHMMKHAALLAPKFEMVEKTFNEELVARGIGSFMHVNGGYFVSFESLNGLAKDIVDRCKKAGVVLTKAGAPFPYGKDPEDKVIRIAPSYPEIDELKKALDVFVCCVKLASVEKMLG